MSETETATGQELQVLNDEDVELAIKGHDVKMFVEDPMEIQRAIVDRILAGDSVEAILDQGTALKAQDNLWRPFMVHGVRFANSQFTDDAGPRIFAILDVEFLDGGENSETVKPLTVGGMNVLAQIYALRKIGKLEGTPLKITEIEGTTASGYKPLWLAAATDF